MLKELNSAPSYISKKLHELNRQKKNQELQKKENRLIVGVIVTKKTPMNFVKFIATGQRSKFFPNILSVHLLDTEVYEYYYTPTTRQLIVDCKKFSQQGKVYFLSLEDRFYSNEEIMMEIKKTGAKPLVCTHQYLQEDKNKLSGTNVFSKLIPLNSYFGFYVDNKITGGNTSSHFTCGLKHYKRGGYSRVHTSNDYIKTYYPEIDDLLDYQKYYLKPINKKVYTSILNKLNDLEAYDIDNSDGTREVSEFMKKKKKLDNLPITFLAITDIDWYDVFEKSLPAYDFSKIKETFSEVKSYHGESLVIGLGKHKTAGVINPDHLTNAQARKIMKIVYTTIIKGFKLPCSERELARSANGFEFLELAYKKFKLQIQQKEDLK